MEQTVTPYLLYEDGEAAIDFLTRAFGFREIARPAVQAVSMWSSRARCSGRAIHTERSRR